MTILALDSSGLVATVAIAQENELKAEYTIQHKKTHSQTLLPMLEEIRRMTDLDLGTVDAIAVASGPGSFTGLRIGAATAKGLGLALQKPLVEVPTLEGLAYNMWGTDRLVCPLMDARRNQVYTGVYRFVAEEKRAEAVLEMETVIPQCAVDISEIIDRLNRLGEPVIFLGDGVPVFAERIAAQCCVPYSFAPAHKNRQQAASIAALGAVYYAAGRTVEASAHQPEYLRMSQAERERAEAQKNMPVQEAEPSPEEKDEKIVIRPLKEEYLAGMAALEAANFTMPWTLEDFKRVLEDPNSLYLVALKGTQVIGGCGVTNVAGDGYINNVSVLPEYRKNGVACRLMTQLLSRGQTLGIKDYTLEVRTGNEAALRLYEKLSFVSEGIRPGFYENPKEDAAIMWRRS